MVGEREFYGKHRDKTLLRPSGFGGQAEVEKKNLINHGERS